MTSDKISGCEHQKLKGESKIEIF